MDFHQLSVLLVEDNEDDYFLTNELLTVDSETDFKLDWVPTYEVALEAMCHNQHDAYLVDYYLGEKDGLQLLREAIANGCSGPIIILTGRGDRTIDVAAIQAGAVDYLIKDQITPQLLVRSIRHAVQHKLSQEHLKESEKRYRSIFENATIGIFQITLDGYFLTVNPSMACMLAYETPQQMMAAVKNINEVMNITPELQADVLQTMQLNQIVTGLEERLIRKDGSILIVQISIWMVRDEQGVVQYLEGFIEDVTERKQHIRQQEAILKVATALRTAQDRASMLPILLDQLLELLHANAAMLAIRDPLNGDTVFELANGSWASATGHRLEEGKGVNVAVITTGKIFLNNHMPDDPLFAQPEMLADTRAVAGIPLNVRDETIGILWVGRNTDITETDVQLLTAIGEIAANAIHRMTLHEETERRLKQLQTLRTIEQAMTSNLDLEHVLEVLLQQVTSQLPVEAADILLFNAQKHLLEFVSGRGFQSSAVQPAPIKLHRSLVKRLVSDYPTIIIPSLEADKLVADTSVLLESRLPALSAEAINTYLGLPLIARENFKGLLEIFQRRQFPLDAEWLEFLQTLAGQAAIAIDNAKLFEAMQSANQELMEAYESTLEGWARALEFRDRETRGHSQRVTELTNKLCQAMSITSDELTHALRGALLHDIGKMGIPDNILLKPKSLSGFEWEVMRRHPAYAYEMLSPINFLRPALHIPYFHHEKWNGGGYPEGLHGEDIPLEARIFAVVDVWDALRSNRPYRKAWSDNTALAYIRQQAGEHFDPQVVQAFMDIVGNDKGQSDAHPVN
jgi:PAS domain S-box-containing protein